MAFGWLESLGQSLKSIHIMKSIPHTATAPPLLKQLLLRAGVRLHVKKMTEYIIGMVRISPGFFDRS